MLQFGLVPLPAWLLGLGWIGNDVAGAAEVSHCWGVVPWQGLPLPNLASVHLRLNDVHGVSWLLPDTTA